MQEININIPIPADIHKNAKLKAVQQEISLKEFIINSIKKEVDNEK